MADGWRTVRDERRRPWAPTRGAGPDDGRSRPLSWGLTFAGLVVVVLLVSSSPSAHQVDFTRAYMPPGPEHLFGTDHAGRDLLPRTLAGARVSLLVGIAAALTSGALGLLVGGMAGSVAGRPGGWLDVALMRLVDAVNALPHLVLGVVIVALLGPSLSSVIISVALTHWTTTARIVRAEMLSLNGSGFVESAVGAGAGRWWVLSRHLLAHVLSRAMLAIVLMVPHAIMHESALSFLGLGLPDSSASLGTIIEQSRSAVLAGYWWPAVLPGVVLVLLSLAVFGLAERLRPTPTGRRS